MATPPDFSVGQVLTAAQMNAVGIWKVDETSFSAQTGVNIDNVFTADYRNYRIELDITSMSATDLLLFQFRNGSGNVTTSDYDYQLLEYFQTTVSPSTAMGSASNRIQFAYTTGMMSVMDLFDPQTAIKTRWTARNNSTDGTTKVLVNNIDGSFRLTTQFTGFRFFSQGGSATMTGVVRVYGYR
jgi:hypothetical protein